MAGKLWRVEERKAVRRGNEFVERRIEEREKGCSCRHRREKKKKSDGTHERMEKF